MCTLFLDDRINEFRLDEHIGRGGFGTVYRASQMQGDQHLRWVAVKMMHLSAGPSSYADMDIPLESYHKELTGLQFNHKNLVTYHSTGIGTPERISETYRRAILCNPGERGPSLPHPLTECERSSRGDAKVPFVWIAMEYSEAGSLDKEIQHRLRTGGTFDVDEAVGITVQILEGVDYLHRNGVNHRAIKPANILRFRESDLWKVSDFGLTGLTDESGYGRDRSLFLRFGTRGWMAPEQERGGPAITRPTCAR